MSSTSTKALILAGIIAITASALLGAMAGYLPLGLSVETTDRVFMILRAATLCGSSCITAAALVPNKLTEKGAWQIVLYMALAYAVAAVLVLFRIDYAS